ncbi:MAG: hypothetical protein ACRC8W_00025 [Plesiomonas shigelloides]
MATLTIPQSELLREVKQRGYIVTSSTYRPALKLVKLGLVHAEAQKYGRIKLTEVKQ